MREIKFRGHTGATWVYGNLIQYQDSNGKACTQIEETKWDDFGCWDVAPKSVGQFTGLKDREGREIYEGDVVKLSYGIPPTTDTLQVVWYSDYYLDMDDTQNITYCGWWFKNVRKNGCSAPAGIEYQDDIEIIGNAFEHPELVK